MKLLSQSTAAIALLLRSSSTTQAFAPAVSRSTSRFYSTSLKMSKPFAVVVEAEVQPDRMDEFLKVMEKNAQQSRQEPGCLRFDVLRAQDNPNKFFFYELYESPAAVDFHKTQDHYKAWADFKESGGTVTSVTKKADGEFVGN
eukprot:CAMPEP_0176092172 /NCGR_PEP_ID=MMETSP0120_2-20121206/46172_1 /TAXON_ID=160619 /ORGANISM="Kryptoperidinium foliaceum, Strain CCMP 1326" /LENGTH=142 /DNA_ID=CAMNT_0017426077 /DNA_START=52 /DNA_END=480 /DNA_ORIENTATION=+